MREAWGCDAPIRDSEGNPASFASADCPRCYGQDPRCELCGGEGQIGLDRCPVAMASPEGLRLAMYVNLIHTGILPVSGGLEEQSHTFIRGLQLMAKMRADLTEDD